MVTEQPALSFAGLLRQLRAEARLTQEELAAAAGVSPRSVSNLERGINRTAHKDTAVLLAGALGLTGPAGELFVAAARGHPPAPGGPAVATGRGGGAAGGGGRGGGAARPGGRPGRVRAYRPAGRPGGATRAGWPSGPAGSATTVPAAAGGRPVRGAVHPVRRGGAAAGLHHNAARS